MPVMPNVQFYSFSCTFQQKFCKIIRWRTLLGEGASPLKKLSPLWSKKRTPFCSDTTKRHRPGPLTRRIIANCPPSFPRHPSPPLDRQTDRHTHAQTHIFMQFLIKNLSAVGTLDSGFDTVQTERQTDRQKHTQTKKQKNTHKHTHTHLRTDQCALTFSSICMLYLHILMGRNKNFLINFCFWQYLPLGKWA